MQLQRFVSLTFILFFLVLLSCSNRSDTVGQYHAWLESPGGELAFPLHITVEREDGSDGLGGFVVNGIDTARFTQVVRRGDSLFLSYEHYDSHLEASIASDGSLSGRWHRRAAEGERSQLPFRAVKGDAYRYKLEQTDRYLFDGNWKATFTDEDGIFVSEPNGTLHGTFATETGDYRFLEGRFSSQDSTMTLSTFDGTHAFLFTAKMKTDGTIVGDFWSRDTYHATWTARKGANELRNPLQVSASEAVGKQMAFSFPNLSGDTVSASDPQFEGKPMLVYLFGSWCPNCADEAQMIRRLYERYEQTDLKIVGLAFEFTGNFEQDAEMVRRYKERFNIPWQLLVAGISDKESAAEVLPFLDTVLSYPTSIFVDRSHTIQAIHVGFNGPATGALFQEERRRFIRNLNAITGESEVTD